VRALLTSAVRCFALNGYHATTTRDITAAPDGACLDAEGAFWVADAVGGTMRALSLPVPVRAPPPAPAGFITISAPRSK
jgi:hypothetical protein